MPPTSERDWQEEHARRLREAENARTAREYVFREPLDLSTLDNALDAVTTIGRCASAETLVQKSEQRLREWEMERPGGGE